MLLCLLKTFYVVMIIVCFFVFTLDLFCVFFFVYLCSETVSISSMLQS